MHYYFIAGKPNAYLTMASPNVKFLHRKNEDELRVGVIHKRDWQFDETKRRHLLSIRPAADDQTERPLLHNQDQVRYYDYWAALCCRGISF